MYNPLIQLNNQRNDILESLRGAIDLWLQQPNRTQVMLATRAGMPPQMLNDIIQRRRGCSPETFEKITKALGSNGTRFVNAQRFGQPVEELAVDIAEFEDKHNQDLFEMRSKSGRNHNHGTTFSGKE
jgi:plasmid maintenance system antidote protein VapI